MSDVSVVIPARNAAGTIGWALAGLAKQDFGGVWEVIVVDDGSTDDTLQIVASSALEVRVVQGGSQGPALARNAGAAAAAGGALAFLDADCRPAPGWLTAGLEALTGADLVQGSVYPDPAQEVGPFDRTLYVKRLSALHESANMFVRREAFARLGGFESWLGPRNGKELGEDVWFGWRARRAGLRIVFSDGALVDHAVFPRGVSGYVAERARLRFFPAMARRMPELRDHFFYRRWFLTRRSAAFDLALAGCAVAALGRKPCALVAALPYLEQVSHRVRGGSVQHAVKVLAGELAADSVSFAALAAGSARSGALVI